MSEGGDKKHDASPHRRQQAREKGQVARSQDMGSALVLLLAVLALRWFGPQIAQTVGILQRAGYTEDDLRNFWHTVWKKDWRWTRNRENPTLVQVRAEIGKLRVNQQAEALALQPSTARDANGKPILTPEELEMQRLMREAKERGRLAREAAQNAGLRVPDLQRHEVGLP